MKKGTILLEGPVSVGVYHLRVNGVLKEIIIMGERHRLENCPMELEHVRMINLGEFLKWYHHRIGMKKTLDIFLESAHVASEKALQKSSKTIAEDAKSDYWRFGLGYLRKRLNVCAPKFDKSVVPYFKCPRNVHVHLCDTRLFHEVNKEYSEECAGCLYYQLIWVSEIFFYNEYPLVSYRLLDIYQYLERFLFNKESIQYHTNITREIMEDMKIDKQIENIPSKRVQAIVKKWATKQYKNALNKIKRRFLKIKKNHLHELKPLPLGIKTVSEKCQNAFAEFDTCIIDLTSVFMDVYLMARALRTFQDGTTPENIIIYVGNWHAENYFQLMDMLKAKKILNPLRKTEDFTNTSCVDITSFYRSKRNTTAMKHHK